MATGRKGLSLAPMGFAAVDSEEDFLEDGSEGASLFATIGLASSGPTMGAGCRTTGSGRFFHQPGAASFDTIGICGNVTDLIGSLFLTGALSSANKNELVAILAAHAATNSARFQRKTNC